MSATPTSTSAPPSSARAPPLLPVDRRRLPLGPCPFSRGPPPRRRPRAPCRPTTSSPSVAAPLPYQDVILLPAGHFPNRRPGTTADSSAAADSVTAASADSVAAASADSSAVPHSPLTPYLLPARHAWRSGMGPAVQRRLPRLGWFFFKMQLHVYNF
jgi:hypothetical protein